jgi:protein-glutamine gamma-glutamyltransferase
MSFDKALHFTSIVLAAASFVGLALGSSLPEWLLWFAGTAVGLVLLHTVGVVPLNNLARVNPSRMTWNVLLVVVFLGFIADMLWISGDLLPAGIHFLVILMVIKLFHLHLRRDYLHLYVISLMAILASAASTTDLWYLPIFLTYLFTGVWTLLLFQLTKPAETGSFLRSSPEPAINTPTPRVTPQLFWLANGLALGTLGFTILIFFSIPRVSAGFLKSGAGESIRTSGFSDTVNLGAIGPIKRDPSIVMRVELPEPSAQKLDRLYLRGVAYDRYDGTAWTNQFTHRRMLVETAPMEFTVRRPQSVMKLGPTLRQHILLESLDTAVLFAAPFAETVNGRFPALQSDAGGGLYLPFPSSSRIEYAVVSRPHPLMPADHQSQPIAHPESFSRHFLQTPHDSDTVAVLAREITHNEPTSYGKAVAIERFLSRNFRYSLDVPLAEQTHPLEDFLFKRKTGYCEHYATAMVIMLRTVGIPARLVTGFLATEWNDYGNYFLVRQQDAHAWVEIHLPRSGWVTMDPTPAVTEGRTAPQWQAFNRVMDHLRLRWNRFFVQYSATDQIAMVREVTANSTAVKNKAWDSLNTFWSPLATGLENALRYAAEGNLRLLSAYTGLMLLGITALAWFTRIRLWTKSWLIAPPPQQAMTQLYRKMLRYLSRRGFPKPAAIPPLEFLAIVRERWKAADTAVTIITGLYCRARFGHTPPTEEELHLAEDSLRQLKALERTYSRV